ncbi:hypothetical protein SERLA73DRAFT_171938 [Serpula lacrymans var. lacrymans S7.3]|uniref:Enoyl reductase (ER) domain-containing protein n=2 Tax=Serpula lacrymans var. lacrymans TaxID=341189 RepID=F8QDD2_SERL3|nr:alcohol dehydrogenase [Serpula lacrymans var. lacrymans S7.9]EGN93603.1 hypothetical protein SERLA73DRAFT_171938 [Serpula lacrymans var. lacrymans S7.3]EGO18975.1 alcohol dehydrogenase [Serpula lacrymans var. lacrymans S7.9]
MKALVTSGDGGFEINDIAIPVPDPDEVLVKVHSVTQNPTDWKSAIVNRQRGNVVGCDFSGTIVVLGQNVSHDVRKVGERVAGVVHGGIGPNGAFAEYVVVPADLVIVIPDTMSFENAAQLGVACFTSCQSLYQSLKLPTPLEPTSTPKDVLIWSGTSSTGQYAVQFAKLGGLRVITTASPQNFELVKSLGADEVFDYADSKTPKKIVAASGGNLKHAVDCISEGMTPNQVSMSLSRQGGTIATLLPYESKKKGVDVQFVVCYAIFGKAIEYPFPFPANEEYSRNASMHAKMISQIVAQHNLTPIPIKLFPRGLASVADGIEYMKLGKVHAEKITYRLADTPGVGTA